MKLLISIVLFIIAMIPIAYAGSQQDFFQGVVQTATGVKIKKIGPEKMSEGGLRQHILLDSSEKTKIEEVVALIEMIDPRPEKKSKDEETWKGSVLSFGIADYVIEFFKDSEVVVSYATNTSFKFLTPLGAHAPQPIELMLDYPLTRKSSKKLKRFIIAQKKKADQ